MAILQPAIGYEWAGVGGQTHDTKFMTLALYAGLIVGASFWGCSADIIGLVGRKALLTIVASWHGTRRSSLVVSLVWLPEQRPILSLSAV